MNVTFFLRELNATQYEKLASEVDVLPRLGETLTVTTGKQKKYYQVIGVNHIIESGAIEIYGVQTEPSWDVKKSGSIGFSFK
jgi:hypothetical protein